MHQTLLSLLFVLIAGNCAAFDFRGDVVGVADGDTISVQHDGVVDKVRLSSIDCPEKKQAFGNQAKQAVSKFCFRKQVAVRGESKDRNGRLIGTVTLADGTNLNEYLVGHGLAWWFKKYAPDDKVLQSLELAAREKKIGLWRDTNPTPPWEFRAHKRQH
jgi:micrococcal nuclease